MATLIYTRQRRLRLRLLYIFIAGSQNGHNNRLWINNLFIIIFIYNAFKLEHQAPIGAGGFSSAHELYRHITCRRTFWRYARWFRIYIWKVIHSRARQPNTQLLYTVRLHQFFTSTPMYMSAILLGCCLMYHWNSGKTASHSTNILFFFFSNVYICKLAHSENAKSRTPICIQKIYCWQYSLHFRLAQKF